MRPAVHVPAPVPRGPSAVSRQRWRCAAGSRQASGWFAVCAEIRMALPLLFRGCFPAFSWQTRDIRALHGFLTATWLWPSEQAYPQLWGSARSAGTWNWWQMPCNVPVSLKAFSHQWSFVKCSYKNLCNVFDFKAAIKYKAEIREASSGILGTSGCRRRGLEKIFVLLCFGFIVWLKLVC